MAMNKTWWWIAAFIVVGVLLGTGVIFLVSRPPRGEPIVLLPVPTPAPITVYVQGGVNQPGLYSLPQQSRINDAIMAAGGFSSNGDTGSLNLAEILKDGDQVSVPTLRNPTANVEKSGQATASSAEPTNSSPTIIDINTATIDELDTLPEIGPKTAQAIIDYRTTHGLFTKIDDILEVQGIGPETFEKIRDLITIGTLP
jgi:competence protein ComEA